MIASARTWLPWLARVPAHSAWLGMLAVAAAFGLFAAVHVLWPASGEPGLDDATLTPPPLEAEAAHVRCRTCGIVEAIARREAIGGRPAAWVFSVRLPDGSLRHSPDAVRGRWQVGDGMQLIGGDRTWNLP